MSQFVIYLKLPRYLSSWLTCHLGAPAVFPVGSPQNAIIRTFLQKLPKGVLPETQEPGTVAIAIPDSVAKPPEYFNYMGPRGKAAVAETIKDLFLRQLWSEVSPLTNSPVGLNMLIASWCEMNGIDIDGVEAVRQCYYRIRKSYAKSGILIKKK